MNQHVQWWTAAEDATLVQLVNAGVSASGAAEQMGRARSSVLGRAFRKGLHFKSSESRPAVRRVKRSAGPAPKLERFALDEDARIIELAAEGKSASEIGLALDRSRSSVIKRARRLGAKLTGKPGGKANPDKVPKVKPVKLHLHAGNIANKRESRANDPGFRHVTPIIALDPLLVSLVDLKPDQCKFPIGDPRQEGFGFCGHPRVERSYCAAHAALCYTPPELRRRAA